MLTIFLTICLLAFRAIYGLSVCDEVELTFLLDKDFILHDYENLEKFLLNIIWDGTSEYSSYSIYLYGEDIPLVLSQNNKLLSSKVTHSILNRKAQSEHLVRVLHETYQTLATDTVTVEVRLNDTFTYALNEEVPARLLRKQGFLGKNGDIISGHADGDRVYFIFDYNNQVVEGSDVCDIMNHFAKTENERVHFIMGQDYQTGSTRIVCGKKVPKFINTQTFFKWSEIIDGKQNMEILLAITCPAKLHDSEEGNYLHLNSRAHYVTDINVIVGCEEIWKDKKKMQLKKKSTMTVRNYYNDDMTFNVGGYLIFEADTYNSEIINTPDGLNGCTQPIYRITAIKITDDTNPDYETLILSVRLPQSPREYISSMKFSQRDMDRGRFEVQDKSGSHHSAGADFEAGMDDRRNMQVDFSDAQVAGFPLDLSTSGSWSTGGSFSVGLGDLFSFSGNGNLTLEYEIGIYVDMYLDLDVEYSVTSDDLLFYYRIHGYVDISTYIMATVSGYIELDMTLFYWSPLAVVVNLGIPVLIRPFVELGASIITVPMTVNAGLDCTYREAFESGYYYNYFEGVDPHYSLVAEDLSYTSSSLASWEVDSVKLCAREARGFTGSCDQFEYTASTGVCSCKSDATGSTETTAGTNIYALDRDCIPSSTFSDSCKTPLTGCDDYHVAIDSSSCGLLTTYTCVSCSYNLDDVAVIDRSNYTFSNTTILDQECEKSLGISQGDGDHNNCSNSTFGFDLIVKPKIGAYLYQLVQVYTRADLTFPFRMYLPEFNNSRCDFKKKKAMCREDLWASFWMSGTLDVYMGVDLSALDTLVTLITTTLASAFGEVINDTISFDLPEIPIIENLTVIPHQRIGECYQLKDDIFDATNAIYADCCTGNSETSSGGGDERLFENDLMSETQLRSISFFAMGVGSCIFVFTLCCCICYCRNPQLYKGTYKYHQAQRANANDVNKVRSTESDGNVQREMQQVTN